METIKNTKDALNRDNKGGETKTDKPKVPWTKLNVRSDVAEDVLSLKNKGNDPNTTEDPTKNS